MMRLRFLGTVALVVAGLCLGIGSLQAQTNVGRISGTVADTSGGVLPAATVTVTNTDTRLARTATTDAKGFYLFTNLPMGTYDVAAELAGFKKSLKRGYALVADGRINADLTLEIGGQAETIEVAVPGETINTISGEVARTVDRGQVESLALNGRMYLGLVGLVPGSPLLMTNPLDAITNPNFALSVNGTRGNTNNLTVDGAFNLDSGSNGSQHSYVGIDFIQEVNVKTANFSAEYGRNSGPAINVATRAGGNKFSGSASEFHRDDRLDANAWENNRKNVKKAPLDYNNFGWTLGGPVVRDKLFFFAGQEWRQVDRKAPLTTRTIPTRAMRQGDFSALSTVIKDPKTGLPYPGNRIPAGDISADGKAIASIYDKMEEQARLTGFYDDSLTRNNVGWQPDYPLRYREDILRLDFRPSQRHAFVARAIHDDYKLTYPYGTFIDSNMPTVPTVRNRPGYNILLSHTWLVSDKLVNEFKAGTTWNSQRIEPQGDAWKRDTHGFAFPEVYQGGARYTESMPDIYIQDYANARGALGWMMSPATDINFTNTLTMLAGSHTLKLGAMYARNRKDQNGRAPAIPSINFATTRTGTTGNAFADALLGNFQSYSEADLDPVGMLRFSQYDAFLTDNWRVNSKLSVEVGVRFQYLVPTYFQANNTANFDPEAYDPSQAVTVTSKGLIDQSMGGNPVNGLVRPGAVPESELGRVPAGNSARVLAVPVGGPSTIFNSQGILTPRLSFSYSLNAKTAVRGGVGQFVDRPEGNLQINMISNPPFAYSVDYQNGNLSNPSGATAAARGPFAGMSVIDQDLKFPKMWNWSLGVQRELPWGILSEVSYVGSHGQDLLRRPDINMVPFEVAYQNQLGAKVNTNSLRPYKGFSAINYYVSDGYSNYNSLQVFMTKRKGPFTASVAYTYSQFKETNSGNGDGVEAAQDNYDLKALYGIANNDRPHILVVSYTWELPFFKSGRGVSAVLGGWELSGITRYQSGGVVTVQSNSLVGVRRADYVGGDILLPEGERGKPDATGAIRWTNPAAFAKVAENRAGNAGRNTVRAPSLETWDVSLRKKFPIKGSANLLLQIDAFNVLNHVNLAAPAGRIDQADFGTITSSVNPRNLQVGARFSF